MLNIALIGSFFIQILSGFDIENKILQDILPDLMEMTDGNFNCPQIPEYYIYDSLLSDTKFRNLSFDEIDDPILKKNSESIKGDKLINFMFLEHHRNKVLPTSKLRYNKERYQISIVLSRIVVNENKAVCIIDYLCDPDCGGGGFLILQKKGIKWRIKDFNSRWVY